MDKKIILISVDHKWRDLAGYVYAKILLEQLGYRVILIRPQFEKQYAEVFNPCAMVRIHLYDQAKNEMIMDLKKRNILVFLMPTEGIPTMKGIRELAAGYFSDLSDIDMQFLWNDSMRKLMEDGDVIDSKKLCVTGVPRFDFYSDPLKEILLNKSQFAKLYGLDSSMPIVTWATNFTNAGFFENNMDFLKKDWQQLQVDKVYDPEQIAKIDFISRQMHIESILRLVTEFKNINLIIKLHPSEDHTFYYKKISTLNKDLKKRITIINQQYIWDILNVTDVLLDRSCTTSIEAWLMGKPTIELRINPDEWYYSSEHASGSVEVFNYSDLKKNVNHYLGGGEIDKRLLENRKCFIKRWCGEVDGNATMRFVSKIHELIQGRDSNVVTSSKITLKYLKSLLLVSLLEISNFKIHDLKVYGCLGQIDKLGRYDKYFNRKDEMAWRTRISPVIA